jgi:hypothetical protein
VDLAVRLARDAHAVQVSPCGKPVDIEVPGQLPNRDAALVGLRQLLVLVRREERALLALLADGWALQRRALRFDLVRDGRGLGLAVARGVVDFEVILGVSRRC